jgi:hypothetical protein
MGRNYLIPFCFFLFLNQSFGQIGFGLRGGFGGSNSSQELVTDLTRDIGTAPTFGLMINYDLDLHFSAGMEVNYTKFSETLNYSAAFAPKPFNVDKSDSIPASTSTTVSYLQIPFYGRVTFGEKSIRHF